MSYINQSKSPLAQSPFFDGNDSDMKTLFFKERMRNIILGYYVFFFQVHIFTALKCTIQSSSINLFLKHNLLVLIHVHASFTD